MRTYDTEPNVVKMLSVDAEGKVANTISNALTILQNDSRLRNKLMLNKKPKAMCVVGALPWDEENKYRLWTDYDDSHLFSLM